MRVFFDTHLLLDVIENRAGLVEASQDVLDGCDGLQAETFIALAQPRHGLLHLEARQAGQTGLEQTIPQ